MYIQNPPEGYSADDIRNMSYEELLDMDYFLNEDDIFDFDDDDFEDGFLSSDLHRSFSAPFSGRFTFFCAS